MKSTMHVLYSDTVIGHCAALAAYQELGDSAKYSPISSVENHDVIYKLIKTKLLDKTDTLITKTEIKKSNEMFLSKAIIYILDLEFDVSFLDVINNEVAYLAVISSNKKYLETISSRKYNVIKFDFPSYLTSAELAWYYFTSFYTCPLVVNMILLSLRDPVKQSKEINNIFVRIKNEDIDLLKNQLQCLNKDKLDINTITELSVTLRNNLFTMARNNIEFWDHVLTEVPLFDFIVENTLLRSEIYDH